MSFSADFLKIILERMRVRTPLLTRGFLHADLFSNAFAFVAGWQASAPFLGNMEIVNKKQNSRFEKFAWFALGFNLLVILWGVFLRASFSGDGCGQHWLTCKGEVIPSAPELKTVIEFTHRLTSGLALIVVFALWLWSRKEVSLAPQARLAAKVSFIFVVIEALIGGGLVLTGNTAGAVTASRPFWMSGHLVNTFCLLAALALTARFASGAHSFALPNERRDLLLIVAAFLGVILVGITGTFAALASMIFPSASIAEGFARDFAQESHLWVRLRVLHPIAAVALGFYLITLGGWFARRAVNDASVKRWSRILSTLVVIQLVWGALTLFTHAPILMQLGHLLLADLVLIALVYLTASFGSRR